MKRRAVDTSASENPKRKLRNRYDADYPQSTCTNNELPFSPDSEKSLDGEFGLQECYSKLQPTGVYTDVSSAEIKPLEMQTDTGSSIYFKETKTSLYKLTSPSKALNVQNSAAVSGILPKYPVVPLSHETEVQEAVTNDICYRHSSLSNNKSNPNDICDQHISSNAIQSELIDHVDGSICSSLNKEKQDIGEGKDPDVERDKDHRVDDSSVNPLVSETIITEVKGDEESDNDSIEDDESKCSGSDTGDRNYEVNVTLYGTDLEEESAREEKERLHVPNMQSPDLNNNHHVPKEQSNSNGIQTHMREEECTITILSSGESRMDEGSNTVDGFTRRALESQCKITDESHEYDQSDTPLQQNVGPTVVTDDTSVIHVLISKENGNQANINSETKEINEKTAAFPTDFSGVFKHPGDNTVTSGMFDPVNVPHSYGSIYRHQESQYPKASSSNILSPRYSSMMPRPGMMASPLNVDNIVAEQLASELVQTYSGENSHMISDILRRRTGGQFEDVSATQNMLHEVDLLNTPQQLPLEENDFGNGNVRQSTPEGYRRNAGRVLPLETGHGRMTFNDIQLYGGKWSTYQPQTAKHPYNQELSENPYPSQHESMYRHLYTPDAGSGDSSPLEYTNTYPQQDGPQSGAHTSGHYQNTYNDYRQFNIENHINKPFISPQLYPRGHPESHEGGAYSQSLDPLGLKGVIKDCPRPSHEVTKMTYTPRDVMQSHLSHNGHYPKSKIIPNQPISDMDYSSIYPSRDDIDKHLPSGNQAHRKAEESPSSKGVQSKHQSVKKRYKPSKYDQLPRAPPMPIFDEMMSKYPPPFSSEMEPLNTRHKYVVVNPSQASEMPSKTLLLKYIDFLILENEQITDISQSPGAPEDIYVTEDMYFMDTLKYKVPFPSKKFVEWVASFFPKLNFKRMKFKGSCPVPLSDDGLKVSDPRPTQQVLEDTFYFFQRSLMNQKG